jgi:hypothetical protein
MCVCVVCMFHHNSGTPGAISTKLGTHIAIYIHITYIYINVIYIYIYMCVCIVCMYVPA